MVPRRPQDAGDVITLHCCGREGTLGGLGGQGPGEKEQAVPNRITNGLGAGHAGRSLADGLLPQTPGQEQESAGCGRPRLLLFSVCFTCKARALTSLCGQARRGQAGQDVLTTGSEKSWCGNQSSL